MKQRSKNIDFSKGSVWKIIVAQAVPLTIAQLVQLTYNVVDRIFIGHIGSGTGIELTGVGLTFPIIALVYAFTALLGTGAVPLFGIARGAKEEEKAERILGNAFFMLLIGSIVLASVGIIFRRPILFLFGASDTSYVYAGAYLKIFLLGTPFSMFATGLNGFINAQGFPRIGMATVMIGAIINIILDPLFIYGLHMGVQGAAIASVISQAISAAWALRFLTGKQALQKLRRRNIRFIPDIAADSLKLGIVSFIMQASSSLVQIACNSTLQAFGGDIYIAIMTVINSVREILMLPVTGVFNGSQPVLSYNYGAKENSRVISGIRFNTVTGGVYTIIMWAIVILFPTFWFRIFSDSAQTALLGSDMLKIYFFGFVFMTFQFAGQSTFQALGDAKHAIFFSLLRKIIIVVPLTFLLPHLWGLGVKGVFIAEPISNVIGGLACYITMRLTVYRELQKPKEPTQEIKT